MEGFSKNLFFFKFFVYQLKINVKRNFYRVYYSGYGIYHKLRKKEIKININEMTKNKNLKDSLILNLINNFEVNKVKKYVVSDSSEEEIIYNENQFETFIINEIKSAFISIIYKDCISSCNILKTLDFYFKNYSFQLKQLRYLYYIVKSEFEILIGNMNESHKFLNLAFESSVINYSLNSEETLMILSKFMGLYFQIGEYHEGLYFLEIISNKIKLIKKQNKSKEIKEIFYLHYTEINNLILSFIKSEIFDNVSSEGIDLFQSINRLSKINTIFNFNKQILDLSKINLSGYLKSVQNDRYILDIMYKIDYIQSYIYISTVLKVIFDNNHKKSSKFRISSNTNLNDICKNQDLYSFLKSFMEELIELLEKLAKSNSNDIIILTMYEKILFAKSNLLEIYFTSKSLHKFDLMEDGEFKMLLKNFKLIITKYIELSHKIFFETQPEMYYNKLSFLNFCSNVLKNNSSFQEYFLSNYESISKFYNLKINKVINDHNIDLNDDKKQNLNKVDNEGYKDVNFNYEFLLALNYLGIYNLRSDVNSNELLKKVSIIFEKNFGPKSQKAVEINEMFKQNNH